MKQESRLAAQPLAEFAATVRWQDIPADVQHRAIDLFVDWFGSVLAGCAARPAQSIARFARAQGLARGTSELVGRNATTSPMMAALANAAASHIVEQDDVHNGAVFHPAAVVFPPALAIAQDKQVSGAQFMTACVVGYEVGIRVGAFLGRSHYKNFHTTGTAGTLAAAAAAGHVLDLTPVQMQHAFGSAGTQAAGLWEFLRTGADSKPLHTAHASSAGLMAACLAQDGFTGARDIFTGPQGMAAGMSTDANPAQLVDRLGTRWAMAETSFKWHASCRHTHPSADALLQVMQQNGLDASAIAGITCHVHQGAIDVLGSVTNPTTVHQSKFSMGTVLALIARFGHAGLMEFDRHMPNPRLSRCVTRSGWSSTSRWTTPTPDAGSERLPCTRPMGVCCKVELMNPRVTRAIRSRVKRLPTRHFAWPHMVGLFRKAWSSGPSSNSGESTNGRESVP